MKRFFKAFDRSTWSSPETGQRLTLLLSLSFVLGFVESLVPKPLPFMRLGLSNIPMVSALSLLPLPAYFALAAGKAVLTAYMGGTLFSPLFALSFFGSTAAACVMRLLASVNLGRPAKKRTTEPPAASAVETAAGAPSASARSETAALASVADGAAIPVLSPLQTRSPLFSWVAVSTVGSITHSVVQMGIGSWLFFGASVWKLFGWLFAFSAVSGCLTGIAATVLDINGFLQWVQTVVPGGQPGESTVPEGSPVGSWELAPASPAVQSGKKHRVKTGGQKGAALRSRLFFGGGMGVLFLLMLLLFVITDWRWLHLIAALLLAVRLAFRKAGKKRFLLSVVSYAGMVALYLAEPRGELLFSVGTWKICWESLQWGLRQGALWISWLQASDLCLLLIKAKSKTLSITGGKTGLPPDGQGQTAAFRGSAAEALRLTAETLNCIRRYPTEAFAALTGNRFRRLREWLSRRAAKQAVRQRKG